MKTRALWGMMAVAGFVMMAFVMTVAPTSVRAQAPPSSCGNAIVEPGEECDPPTSPCTTSPGGAFGTCDAACQCIENTTTTIATTTSTIAVTTTVTTTSSTVTTLPSSCGNAIIDPGEQCDPPSSPCTTSPGGAFGTCDATCQCVANTTTTTLATTTTVSTTSSSSSTLVTTTSTLATTTTVATTSTTTTIACSPTPENTSPTCGDMIDNDCDNLIDCADPDCAGIFPCPPAAKDPTIIQFGRSGRLDRMHGHAKLTMATVDLTKFPVNVLLSDLQGVIYTDGLPAGALSPNSKGSIFLFRNSAAKTTGGMADVKIKKNKDGATYTFSFTTYGDLSRATDSHMRLQFYIGDDDNAARDGRIFITIPTPWSRTPNGWRAPKDH